MVVKKKHVSIEPQYDSIDLSKELLRVRGAITQLQLGDTTMETPATGTSDGPEKKPPTKKKVAGKKPGVKKKAAEVNGNLISLSDVCKELKMQPRMARRVLRSSKLKREGRWAWEKGSADLTKVKAALKSSQAEEK